MMENKDRQGQCFIWGTRAEIRPHPEKKYIDIVDSPRAGGEYCAFSDTWLLSLDEETKTRLTSWLVKQRLLGVRCPEVDAKTANDENYGLALKINERADRLLKLIELESPTMGYQVNFYTENLNPEYYTIYEKILAWSESTKESEVRFLLEYLQESGRITIDNNLSGGTVIITPTGYIHLEEMKNVEINSSQAFVVMWFDPSMSEIYEKGIKPAIVDSGYTPFRVDEPRDVDKIDDRIIAEIRRSRFIVADFTHDSKKGVRGNVYYEVGFARGLGRNVFSTCRGDLIEELPFDTRQYYHIAWGKNNLEDLRKNLADRISAIVGDGPMKSKQ